MQYTSIPPHPTLAPYIDAYWSVNGAGHSPMTNRILPDGCMDIIFNLGEDDEVMKSGKGYLVGTMTRAFDTMVNPGSRLMGIRFKPAAFAVFYKFSSLHEITDCTIECEKRLAPELGALRQPVEGLNDFFLKKLSRPKHVLFPILEDIHRHHGQVRVEELTRRHFVTARQLERSFKYYTGVSPKEFINQERFRYALQAIRHKQPGQDLSDVAFACGYYDQAHERTGGPLSEGQILELSGKRVIFCGEPVFRTLPNEIRRYTGEMPSRL